MSVFILSCKTWLGNTSDILMKDNFHSVFMEDEEALDHLSPTHKDGAQRQKQCQCSTDGASSTAACPDAVFRIPAPSAGILSSVHGAAEVLPHSTSPAQAC